MFVMLSCSHDSLHNGGEKYHNRSQFRANDGLEQAAHLCDEIDVAADVAGKENHGDEQGKTGCHVAEAARLRRRINSATTCRASSATTM